MSVSMARARARAAVPQRAGGARTRPQLRSAAKVRGQTREGRATHRLHTCRLVGSQEAGAREGCVCVCVFVCVSARGGVMSARMLAAGRAAGACD